MSEMQFTLILVKFRWMSISIKEESISITHMGRLTSIRVTKPSIVQFPRVHFKKHLDVIRESSDDLSVETSTFLIEETRISEI